MVAGGPTPSLGSPHPPLGSPAEDWLTDHEVGRSCKASSIWPLDGQSPFQICLPPQRLHWQAGMGGLLPPLCRGMGSRPLSLVVGEE